MSLRVVLDVDHCVLLHGDSAQISEVLDALQERMQLERQRTIEFGGAGVVPWDRFLARGDVQR